MKGAFQPQQAGRCSFREAGLPMILRMACVATALAMSYGCGRGSSPATVEGTLRLDEQPLDNCLVTFLPEPGPSANGHQSSGLTDRQGSYRLRRDDQQEGAAIGLHRVTIQDLSVSTGIRRRDHGMVDEETSRDTPPPPPRPSRVPKRFMSSTETPLRKELQAGHQVIDLEIGTSQ